MNRKRVLIVEGHDATRIAIVKAFTAKGYEVTAVSTIAAALPSLNERTGLLLVELLLPDGPGEKLLRKVRAESLPVRIAICTRCDDSCRIAGLRALRPQVLIPKPINYDTLVSSCEETVPTPAPMPAYREPAAPTRVVPDFRVPFFAKVTVAAEPSGQASEGHTVDISLSGGSMVCPASFSINQQVSLIFLLSAGGRMTAEGPVRGVVNDVRFERAFAVMGVKFVPPLNRSSTPELIRLIERI